MFTELYIDYLWPVMESVTAYFSLKLETGQQRLVNGKDCVKHVSVLVDGDLIIPASAMH